MFNVTNEEIERKGAFHTSREIHHQPDVWRKLLSSIEEKKSIYREFLESIYNKHSNVQVILTGAGTSAFIGDTLAPELNKSTGDNILFTAIPTTDIVSNPREYLDPDRPVIMVSFARSGNSPESVAAVDIGAKMVKDFYQVVITCNKDGELAVNTEGDNRSITVLMPEESNDRSLAMTSSFTTMLLAAYELFVPDELSKEKIGKVLFEGERMVENVGDSTDTVLKEDFDRIVYLGSGSLGDLSHEAALKMLELTGGNVIALHESSLGFRHGPKSILTEKTVVVLFVSSDSHARKYDIDLLKQLYTEKTAGMVVALTHKKDEEAEKYSDEAIALGETAEWDTNDIHIALVYIIFAQTLALKKSMMLGITPDNPSPGGEISRVVQGVTIHDYNS